jgi:hypothetical protein
LPSRTRPKGIKIAWPQLKNTGGAAGRLLSTGPKTEAGKEQARINGQKGGRPREKPKS